MNKRKLLKRSTSFNISSDGRLKTHPTCELINVIRSVPTLRGTQGLISVIYVRMAFSLRNSDLVSKKI